VSKQVTLVLIVPKSQNFFVPTVIKKVIRGVNVLYISLPDGVPLLKIEERFLIAGTSQHDENPMQRMRGNGSFYKGLSEQEMSQLRATRP
jgi:hypothetical protein